MNVSEMNRLILTDLEFSVVLLRLDVLCTPLFGASGPKPRLRRT